MRPRLKNTQSAKPPAPWPVQVLQNLGLRVSGVIVALVFEISSQDAPARLPVELAGGRQGRHTLRLKCKAVRPPRSGAVMRFVLVTIAFAVTTPALDPKLGLVTDSGTPDA
jgi:hypothetical protein